MKAFTECMEEAMLIASDSYSVSPSHVEFADFLSATACLSEAPYVPAAGSYRETVTLN